MKAIVEIHFLLFSNVDIRFAEIDHLTWRNYTATKSQPRTKRVNLINEKEFTKANLDKNTDIFVIQIAILLSLSIYSTQQP